MQGNLLDIANSKGRLAQTKTVRRTQVRPCLQGGTGNPGARVTLAYFSHISSFFTQRVYEAGRVTLALR